MASLLLPSSRKLRLAGLAVFFAANLYLLSNYSSVRTAARIVWDDDTASAAVDIARTLESQLYVPIGPRTPLLPRARRHYPTNECLELSLAQGGMCDARGYGIPENFQLDLVWSWVNSSDPLWRRTRAQVEARRAGIADADVDYDTPISHFDNYDELRYSMRAALQSWGKHVRRFHLIAADFPLPDEFPLPANTTSPRDGWRLGQVPTWLAHPCAHDGCDAAQPWIPTQPADAHWPDLAVHHHATFFDPYVGTSFSSFGIESQLPNLRGVSDVVVYLNDDMYFLRDMAPSDYWSAPYGLTIRPQGWIPVPPTPEPNPVRGEWQPLRQTNTWLSQRFGNMTRPYLSHQPKAGSISLWREFSTMFAAQFQRTRLRQFRDVYFEDGDEDEDNDDAPYPFDLDPELNTEGRGNGTRTKGDVHTVFGIGHFVMERHRETLLWSFVVARVAPSDGSWGAIERARAWAELGGAPGADEMRVREWDEAKGGDGARDTRRGERMSDTLAHAGFARPENTRYDALSLDGGAPFFDGRASETDVDAVPGEACALRRAECLPASATTASAAFAHMAFARPRCGDCAVRALVRASGRLGLAAFLPPAERTVRVPRDRLARTLPLAPAWPSADFSLDGVLRAGVPETLREDGEESAGGEEEVRVRAWVLRVLDRYRFVIGDTPFLFRFMRSADEAAAVTREVSDSSAATVCLNDDVESPGASTDDVRWWQLGRRPVAEGEKVRGIVRAWQTWRWPVAAAWERT